MSRSIFALAAASASSLLAAVPATAAVITYVKSTGVDAGNCSTTTSPCRTFTYALSQTDAGGEIKTLDPANYYTVYINKAVSITGVDGASVVRSVAGDAIHINAGAADMVNIVNLTIDGFNMNGSIGVNVRRARNVTIRNCTIRNFNEDGILIKPTVAARYLIEDTVLFNNRYHGFISSNGNGAGSEGVLRRVSASRSDNGVMASDGSNVTVVDSLSTNNRLSGFSVKNGSLRLFHSVATENDFGVVSVMGVAESAGNNFFRGNATNIAGVVTNVGED